MYKHTLTKLPTGLRLITVPMPQLESVSVMIGVAAGSRWETRATSGLFHFLEHMAFKGTQKRPNTLAIASEVESAGGVFNAFTSKETTGYWLKVAAKHKTLAFDILSDILTHSLLPKQEIEREKGVIIEEINMYEDLPMRKVQEDFERLMYGDNPMGWSIAGQKETIRKMKRQDFKACLNQLYYPGNMVVAAAGKITANQSKKLAGQFLGQFDKKGQGSAKKIKIIQKKLRLNLVYKKTEQAHFCLGVPGVELAHPDRYSLMVLSAILGGGMSSRLFIQIRERRGLAYYVGAESESFTDSGYLVARSGVRLNKVDEAVKVTLAEFNRLVSQPVPAKELKKAQEMLKGHLVLALEDSQAVAGRYASQLLLEKKTRSAEQAMRLIDQVTSTDIQRVAKKLFQPQNLNLAVIGPFKSKNRFKNLLK